MVTTNVMNKNSMIVNALADCWRQGETTLCYSGEFEHWGRYKDETLPDMVWYDEAKEVDWDSLLEILKGK